ncbi:MAG: CinA family protein [Mesorhizobium sp.]|nr:CinA family protein [Mesorhizobium sp.]
MTDRAALARTFLEACKARGILVATAESCTGGGIIALMTDLPGSSTMVDRGFVTYSNEAKMDMLGVRKETLDQYGAVSEETAREMAEGALARSRAGITLAVTGIAGPDGGSEEKPVGLVWIGVAATGVPTETRRYLFGNPGRDIVRRETGIAALQMGIEALKRGAG